MDRNYVQAATNSPTASPIQSRLDACAERMGYTLKQLNELNVRLDSIADRMLGAVPQPVRNSNKEPVQERQPAVRHLEQMAESIDAQLAWLGSTVDRLREL